jgi:hypothetical protein
VVHDVGDHFIPVDQARILRAGVPRLADYVEFDIFQHVEPGRPSLSPSFIWQALRLAADLRSVMGRLGA